MEIFQGQILIKQKILGFTLLLKYCDLSFQNCQKSRFCQVYKSEITKTQVFDPLVKPKQELNLVLDKLDKDQSTKENAFSTWFHEKKFYMMSVWIFSHLISWQKFRENTFLLHKQVISRNIFLVL